MLTLDEKVAKHKKLTEGLFREDQEWEAKGEPMPLETRKTWDETAQAAEALAAEIDAEVLKRKRMAGWRSDAEKAAEALGVPAPTLPSSDPKPETFKGDPIVGYVTMADMLALHSNFGDVLKNEFSSRIRVGTGDARVIRHTGLGDLLPITKSQRQAIVEKALPTIAAAVIEPTRLNMLVQATADDEVHVRDVINLSQTGVTNSVEYLYETSYTRAAGSVAEDGTTKAESTASYTTKTATVRTIAVWMPQTTAMLADWPALRGLINGRLMYDLAKKEAELIMYGAGTGTDYEGIFTIAGTSDIAALTRYSAGDSLPDKIRYGVTEIRVAGYHANSVVLHPADFETLAISKGSDENYLGLLFPAGDLGHRIWGLRVVEEITTEATTGDGIDQRQLIVMDGRRAATLWLREDRSVQIGLSGTDFIDNQRTLLAEQRAAFAVTAPAAIAKLETVAAVTAT